MSTIRKNPPQPAPSRIAGTLKLRKPAEAAEAAPEQEGMAGRGRAEERDPPARPAAERSRAAAKPASGRGRETREGAAPRRRDEKPVAGAAGPARERRTDGPGREREARPARRGQDEAPREARAPRARWGDEVKRGDGRGRSDERTRAGDGARGDDRAKPRTDRGTGEARAPAPRGRDAGRGPTAGRSDARPVRGEQGRSEPRRSAATQPAAGYPPCRQESAAAPRAVVARPPLPAQPVTGVRLSKVMADRGICSRREADELIERGWVFVDGKRVSELGTRIDPDARVVLAPEAKRAQAQRVTILLHKPVGYVSGQPEPGYEPAVVLVNGDNQSDRDVAQRFHPSQLKGLAPAGRLDIDSTGLLVFTQDGRVARQLIGDDSKVEKEYLVRVEGELIADGLALLNHGLSLDDKPLRPAKVEWINDDQLRFVLKEGRKRQIRRMCELVGLKVVGLKRVRIGRVRLGELPLGQWRYLREDEVF